MSERTGSRGMWLMAHASDDHRYLLPRRPRQNSPERYNAAEWLVRNGYARWISWTSCFAPGIELTGKPWPA